MKFDDVLELSANLAQEPDRASYLRAVRDQLGRLLPGDDVLWIQAADVNGGGCLTLRGDSFDVDEKLSASLSFYWRSHPHTQSYTLHPHDRTPRRMSDILAPRQWRRREECQALRMGMHEYQLSIIPPAPWRYRGWLIVREKRDFDDEAVDIATAIAPVLAALGALHERLEPWQGMVNRSGNVYGLTARELAVLSALAEGLPADAISHRLGISGRTVGKHLEHIYRKLGCRDRLVAVTLAREMNLLPLPAPTSSRTGQVR